jgi:competence protein ComEC
MDAEQEMISKQYDLKSDVLKVGHHGSNSSSSVAFLKAVSPKYAVISVGKGNDYGHPTQVTLDKIADVGIQVFRTDEAGTIVATSDGETIKFNKNASAIKPQAPPNTTSNPAPGTSESVAPEKPADSNGDVIVYITKTGTKYHIDGCQYLSNSKIPISLSDAIDEGYAPCSKCNPPK